MSLFYSPPTKMLALLLGLSFDSGTNKMWMHRSKDRCASLDIFKMWCQKSHSSDMYATTGPMTQWSLASGRSGVRSVARSEYYGVFSPRVSQGFPTWSDLVKKKSPDVKLQCISHWLPSLVFWSLSVIKTKGLNKNVEHDTWLYRTW